MVAGLVRGVRVPHAAVSDRPGRAGGIVGLGSGRKVAKAFGLAWDL